MITPSNLTMNNPPDLPVESAAPRDTTALEHQEQLDHRLRPDRGPFHLVLRNIDLRPYIWIYFDLPLRGFQGFETLDPDTYGRIVKFPGAKTPGVYFRKGKDAQHYILRLSPRGELLTIDKWSSTKFLILADNREFVPFSTLAETNKYNPYPIDQESATLTFRQSRATEFGQNAELWPITQEAIDMAALFSISTEMDEALNLFAESLANAQQRDVPGVVMVKLAVKLHNIYTARNASTDDNHPAIPVPSDEPDPPFSI